ncbi:MAG: hypothetical protein MST10_06035 [Lentisphaeria bacterium]|nr:hypothetical protein [Lentisphaeria bacterium]
MFIRGKKHFTLIELLVIIVILIILVGMILPTLEKARCSSRQAQCMNNLRILTLENFAYANDNNDFFAPFAEKSNHQDTVYPYRLWWGLQVSKDQVIFNRQGYLSSYLPANLSATQLLICPSQNVKLNFNGSDGGSYGYNANGIGGNGYLLMNKDKTKSATDKSQFGNSVKLSQIKSPSSLLMFSDSVNAGGMGAKPKQLRAIDRIAGPDSFAYQHFRHNQKAVVAWADGHISAEKSAKIVVSDKYAFDLLGNSTVGWIAPDSDLAADHTYYDTLGRANPLEGEK